MQKEHHKQVEKVVIYYVRDFANDEEKLALHSKRVRDNATKNKERMDNYIKTFKDIYENTAMFVEDKWFLKNTIVKGLSKDEQDHWAVKDLYLRNRSKDEKIVAHQKKTASLRDKIGKIIRKLATRIFPTVSQLIDQSEKTNSSNTDEEDEQEEESEQEEGSEQDDDEIGVKERSDSSGRGGRGEERKRKREVEDLIEQHKIVIEEKDRVYNDIIKEKEEWIKQKKDYDYNLKSCMEEKEKIVKEMKIKDDTIFKRDRELYQRDKEIKKMKEIVTKLNENDNLM